MAEHALFRFKSSSYINEQAKLLNAKQLLLIEISQQISDTP